ncbi:cytochrome P450 [Scleroderma citrinum]
MDLPKIAICSTVAVYLLHAALRTWKNQKLALVRIFTLWLPPGPKCLPFFGNLFDINVSEPWLTYIEWGRQYGGVIFTTLLGQNFVVINDKKIAYELLERRSAIYADRPYLSTNKFFGVDFNTGLLTYGKKWRLHRKMCNIAFNKQVSIAYQPMQLRKVQQLLQNLIATPQDYVKYVGTFSGSVIMAITYGYDAAPENDPFVSNALRLMEIVTRMVTPVRAALFTAFPILAYIPSRLPGGRYKQQAGECRPLARRVLDDPVNYVKNSLTTGFARKSLVYDLLRAEIGKDTDLNCGETMKEVAATAFGAGVDTTSAVLLVFVLAMTLYPEVQTKAQEEIDHVVGRDRLPDFGDQRNLPYVECVLLETLRWCPILPEVPHLTRMDDVFDGMYIPKATTVLLNIWAMSHDEIHFPDPSTFKPERYLTSEGKVAEDTSSPIFDIGRVWAAIVSILATLRIGKAIDENGHEIEVKLEFEPGLVMHPKPFRCSIEARSLGAKDLISTTNL